MACGGPGPGPEGPDADDHEAAVTVPTDSTPTQVHPLRDGEVAMSGLPQITVNEDVVVEDVTVGTSTGSAELLYARLAAAAPSPACLASWPAGVSGAAAKGARLKAGERPALVLYLRGTRAVVDQVSIRYRHGDETTDLRWNVRIELKPASASRRPCPG